ncbi:LITAF-like zinc ribbon domain-containing protein [Cladochytrium replicatum]|nr:LITAF-like zinc ribbon domain-containing protein [Cladochytrium replicatum]
MSSKPSYGDEERQPLVAPTIPTVQAAETPAPAAPLYPSVEPPPYSQQNPVAAYYAQNPQVVITADNSPVTYVVEEGHVFIPVDSPVRMFCPYDAAEVVTVVERQPGFLAYCSSALLCLVFWPAFWLPFCSKGCMDRVHRCPRCRHVLAIVPAA